LKAHISRRGRVVSVHYVFDREETKIVTLTSETVFEGCEISYKYVLPNESEAKVFFNGFSKVYQRIPGTVATYPKSQEMQRELIGELSRP